MWRRKTTEEFIRQAIDVHGNGRYDYSLVNYVNNKIKVKIRCLKCGRIFEQTPDSHLRGNGCRFCGIKRSAIKQRLSKEEFLQRLFERFPERRKADFFKFEYINSMTKSTVICENGHEFQIRPNDLMSGYWCPYCAGKIKLTKEEFIRRAVEIHRDEDGNPLYDYSLVEYKNSQTKVKIVCRRCGKIFECTPNNHLTKASGCPYCVEYGFSMTKPALLYYLKIVYKEKVYYKIGVTNKDIEHRFCPSDLQKIEVLKVWKFEKGEDAYKKEQEILRKYRSYKYNGKEKILKTRGNTELFVCDVLGLDVVK